MRVGVNYAVKRCKRHGSHLVLLWHISLERLSQFDSALSSGTVHYTNEDFAPFVTPTEEAEEAEEQRGEKTYEEAAQEVHQENSELHSFMEQEILKQKQRDEEDLLSRIMIGSTMNRLMQDLVDDKKEKEE